MKNIFKPKWHFMLLCFLSFQLASSTGICQVGSSIQQSDGVLVFADNSALQSTLQRLNTDDNYYSVFESQFPGYVSIIQAFERITDAEKEQMGGTCSNDGYKDIFTLVPTRDEEGDALEAVLNVESDLFGKVVNQKGIIQVGAVAYKIGYEYTFKTSSSNISILKTRTNDQLIRTSGVEHILNSHGPNNDYTEYYNEIEIEKNMVGTVRECTRSYDNNKKRMKACLHTLNLGLYSDISATTKHQKKWACIWWANKTKSLSVVGTGTFQNVLSTINGPLPSCAPPCPFSISKTKTNESGVTKVIDFCINFGCSFSFVTANVTHSALCDDNQTRTCVLTVP